MSILQLKNLSLTLDGKRILDNLSIDFWEDYVHAVVGPNGAGKTTLAHTIMGLAGYRDIEGDILFQGNSLEGKTVTDRANLGLTLGWQEPARYEGLTMRRFLGASMRDSKEDNIKEVLGNVGLNPDEYLERNVDRTLSGGERKKVELASIMLMRPKVVILDEPDSGIDIESITRIFDAIKILKEQGTTVILITHSLAVLRQAEHAFLICCGAVADKGDVEKIISSFENKCIPCDHPNRPPGKETGEGR